MSKEFPESTPGGEGIENFHYFPYDFDPAIVSEISRRTPGGRTLSRVVSDWRDAVIYAAERPGDQQSSEQLAERMNAVEDVLEILAIERTLLPLPPEE